MTTRQWLTATEKQLQDAGIGTARLDAVVLLEHVVSRDRAQLLAEPAIELTAKQLTTLKKHVMRRITHEPLAYILEQVEFYGRSFTVTPAVLVPRPESETMIELFKTVAFSAAPRIADVGSGSGALGITCMLERPDSFLTCIDIDKNTLEIARKNASRYQVPAIFCESNLLQDVTDTFDVLLCNLPYVPNNHRINQAAMQEPEIAIFGGEDGLDLYRELFLQLFRGQYGSPVVFTESLPFQHDCLRSIAKQYGYRERGKDDFIQQFEKL